LVFPHYADYGYISKTFSNIHDILVIDINRSVEAVCDDIIACNATISSSLHGIIVSHAYNVPCAWMTVSIYSKWPIGGGKTKYIDYYLSRNVRDVNPYAWNILPRNANKLYSMIKKFPQPSNTIDIEKLVDCCPFGKTLAEIIDA
jgi:hypothetical protein